MTTGLPVSRLINVGISLTSLGAQFANVSSLLILGDSDVIDTQTRIRSYGGLTAIATDFGTTSSEYLAAADYFAAKPQPTQVFVGKWARTATAGRLIGAPLTTAQQLLATFTAITAGSLKLAVDATSAQTLTGLNFSGATNLNGVASIVSAALTGATCVWDGKEFVIKSTTTGAASAVAFPTTPASGVNIAPTLGLNAAQGARSVGGIIAESAVAAVTLIDALPTYFYGLMLASTNTADADHLAIAAYVEAAGQAHLYGLTAQAAAVLDPTSTTDIAYLLQAAGYQRTFGIYSSTDPYAVAAMFGRLLTVNYSGSNTTINMMYQQLPGIIAETLTSAQADALDAKRINYSANYSNGAAVLAKGECFGPAYIDEITGTDWFANYVQTNLFNLLATVGTKIPQTDDGVHLLVTNANSSCAQGVRNGLFAPGIWTQAGFGQLAQNDNLPSGFYVYAQPLALQPTTDRAARKAPVLQIAAKLAGAVDTVSVVVAVNR